MAFKDCNKPQEAQLAKILSNDAFDCIKWVDVVSSTQDLAKNFVCNSTDRTCAVFIADSQTNGRGTRGRSWHAPALSVLMTVVAPLGVPLEKSSGLTLSAGIAAVEALRTICPRVCIKWPNDLWLENGKLAGILCETCRNAKGELHVAVGIGVNIAVQDDLMKYLQEAGYPASALFAPASLPDDIDKVRLNTAARLARSLRKAVCEFSSESMRCIAAQWSSFDAMFGSRVCFISEDGRQTKGVECGITQTGEIVIEDHGKRRVFSNGSLRLAESEAALVKKAKISDCYIA